MPEPPLLEKFRQALRRSQLSPLSVRAYEHDVALFTGWLESKEIEIEAGSRSP